jgi:uncharacterized protein (DUF58 family)
LKFPEIVQQKSARVYIVPTRYGFLYAFMVFLMLALATVFNNSNCLFATAILVTFGVVCMHQTHSNISSVCIKEVDSQSGFANEAIPWRIKVVNQSPTAAFSLNIFDDSLDAPAREITTENIPLRFRERGRFSISELKISSTYPLGLFYAWKWNDMKVSYYVYPSLGPGEVILSNLVDTKAELESKDDFIGHRDFVPGDSGRHIDWKAQARKQKLLVKLFESTNTDVSILDWEKVPGHTDEEKLSILARAIVECHKTQTPFGLKMPELTIDVGAGTAHLEKCLRYLATFGKTDEQVA